MMKMVFNNLCSSCTNIGCGFQSDIAKTECAFYMPPRIEPDNCGNYVVQPTHEARLKDDTVIILDKIKAEIEQTAYEEQKHDEKWAIGLRYAVKIIDKYSEGKDAGSN